MPTLSDEQRKSLEGQYGELLVLETSCGDVAFKVPTEKQYERFSAEMAEPTSRWMAVKALSKGAMVFPTWEEFDKEYLQKKPAMMKMIGDQLVAFSGAKEGEVRKK